MFKTASSNSSFFYNAGTYQFTTSGDINTSPQSISMTVNPGQIGMFFQFDWNGNTAEVLNVFDVTYINSDMILTPTDVDGNGIAGFAVPQGPYTGVDLALNFTVTAPIPAAAWLFLSGLAGLFITARRLR